MKKFFKWSGVLSLLSSAVQIFPTLGVVLYYYFDNIQYTTSSTAKASLGVACALLILLIIYRKLAKTKVAELRQSVVHEETELKNLPAGEKYDDQRAEYAKNAVNDRAKLIMYDKGVIICGLIVFALSVTILEKAMIGLSALALIACGSVLAGTGLEIAALKVKQKEEKKK